MAKNYKAGPCRVAVIQVRILREMDHFHIWSILVEVSCGGIIYVDQLKEVDDTPSEHSSEQLQESQEDTKQIEQ